MLDGSVKRDSGPLQGFGRAFGRERKKPLFNSALFKQIGRLTFLLSSVFVALLCGGAQLLVQAHPDSDRVANAAKLGVALVGVFWVRSLERRLMDARLPRWCFWPYFLAVVAACVGAHARGILDTPETLVLFVLIQIPTALFPSKPAPAQRLSQSEVQTGASGRPFPEYNRPIGRIQFLLRVLLIAALYCALLQLARGAGPGVVAWEMRVGIVLFAFVWIYSVEGRVLDAGLPRWLSIPYCVILPGLCVLPHLLKIVNVQIALALFVVLQIPTIFFGSRAVPAGFAPRESGEQEASNLRAKHEGKPVRRGAGLDGIEFAVYTLLIAGLWYVLHLLRGDVGFGPFSIALACMLDVLALILFFIWLICVRGRFRDAGLLPWAMDFCLIVLTASVLPLAFEVVRFPVALMVFGVLQIPAVFIRRGSVSAKFLPVDADS
jgi:hypothetical protein